MADYIPSSDAAFNLWQDSLVQQVGANLVLWGIATEDYESLVGKQLPFVTSFGKASNKQNRTSADVQAKNDDRSAYETALRGFVGQWLSNNNKVTDSDRERMGLTVKSGSHAPVPTPTTLPVATIDFSIRLQHTVHFVDDASPRSKAKPEGVYGCEIWQKIGGDAPKDASEMMYLTTCTSSPYKTTFVGTDAGKNAYYWLRWVNKRNSAGPWSSTASAMVVG